MGNDYLGIKSKAKIAILDANNFYVSCERLFKPYLTERPTVVLSNNDGCIIARSKEVKDMGIKMGQPVFQLEEAQKQTITKFSSNYNLYGDISDRIATLLKRLVPRVEVYSIDESFLDLSHISDDKIVEEIKKIKLTIEESIGIPVSIGVAPNKTLAKLCNKISKSISQYEGVCSYWHIDKNILYNLEIEDVWGIGRQWNKKLKGLNVYNVRDFIKLLPTQVKLLMNVNGYKTWLELQEIMCHPLSISFKKPKTISCSRSFGNSIWRREQLLDSVWTFLETCHKKLVKEELVVGKVIPFACTNRFEDDYVYWNLSIKLFEYTDDIQSIWNQVAPFLEQLPVRLWYKSGINFSDLKPKNCVPKTVFKEEFDNIDIPGVQNHEWKTRADFLSQKYTTDWGQLPLVF